MDPTTCSPFSSELPPLCLSPSSMSLSSGFPTPLLVPFSYISHRSFSMLISLLIYLSYSLSLPFSLSIFLSPSLSLTLSLSLSLSLLNTFVNTYNYYVMNTFIFNTSIILYFVLVQFGSVLILHFSSHPLTRPQTT